MPDEISGRGIAGRLVQASVDRASRQGLTLVPWCPYDRNWLEHHPDAAAAVAIDWTLPPEGQ